MKKGYFNSELNILKAGVFLCLFLGFQMRAHAQTCRECSESEIATLHEINNKYLGISGRNPSVPSTYNLIGSHKFSGNVIGPGVGSVGSFAFGQNWFPIREEKQILSGKLHRFGVSNYGDESDWNIHITPNTGFEGFISEAIPYRKDNWYASGDWGTDDTGRFTIEAEITPDEQRFGNQFFNNLDEYSYLVGQQICVYGPFVREEAHGNHPEIHPSEQIWWKEGDDKYKILLLNDDSNRFNDLADYYQRRVTTTPFKAWTQEKGQEAELKIAFEVNPKQGGLAFKVIALDNHNFYSGANYPDAPGATKHTVTWCNTPVVMVEEASDIDQFVGVTFSNVCYNRAKQVVQGYIVLNTAVGNGGGKEGFIALQIDKKRSAFNTKAGIYTGDIANTWKVHNSLYDDVVEFENIISSDKKGKGIVDGIINFNSNEKTDLFASKDGRWMVLYDGKGKWQEINTSSVDINNLRFGDVNGDGVTDIMRVGPNERLYVSFSGTTKWTDYSHVGVPPLHVQVGDFNGDGKTDLVKMTFMPFYDGTFVTMSMGMNVKWSCQGPWKKLNNFNGLRVNSTHYSNDFRFGDFNGDKITDIFRYHGNKFLVYYNGTGSYKILNDDGVAGLRTEDLLFVDNLTHLGYTDIIHVDKLTRKWTFYYGGHPGSLPMVMKHNDPVKVHFGDLDSDPAWEPFALDDVIQPDFQVDFPLVAKMVSEPTVVPKYEEGSIKRVITDGKPGLAMNMNMFYYPGSKNAKRNKNDYKKIVSIKEKSTSKKITFKPGERMVKETQVLGIIELVPLNGLKENEIEVKFDSLSKPLDFELPAYSIGGLTDSIKESVGSKGNWDVWKNYLSQNIRKEFSSLLTSSPSSVEKVKTVQLELSPFYSSVERGKVSRIEMDDAMKELNNITYGTDASKIRQIFGNTNGFTIQWRFELKNMVTGNIIPITEPSSITSKGRWSNSKIYYEFPDLNELLELKASATITDPLGNTSIEPVVFTFYNQRIHFKQPNKELEVWLEKMKDSMGNPNNGLGDYTFLITRGNYLAEDYFFSPAEMNSLLK